MTARHSTGSSASSTRFGLRYLALVAGLLVVAGITPAASADAATPKRSDRSVTVKAS